MNQRYISYHFRSLCVETFPAYGTDIYYDMCIYDHFFELLLRITSSDKDFNMLVFVDKYLKKLDGEKYQKRFEVDAIKGYEAAKGDFLILLSNLYQITLIHNHKNDLSSLEAKILRLGNVQLEKIRTYYKLNESTVCFINNVLEKLKNVFSAKIDYKYDIEEYDIALSNTLALVKNELKQLQISGIVSENSAEVDGYRQRVFDSCKEEITDNLQILISTIEDTFLNNRKIRHLKNADYYLSFLLHDEIISFDGSKKIFRHFYEALLYAYKMQIYFLYFKDKHEKVTLEEILAFFDDDAFKVGTERDYSDRRIEKRFFNIVDNIEVRRDFKHLPLLILGYMLSLDAKTVEKISIHLDNGTLIHNARTKNPNVISRFIDLKYSANSNIVYDLDNDIQEFLEFFNSYKTETVYVVYVIHDYEDIYGDECNGDECADIVTMEFASEEEYINYIRPNYNENEIQDKVEDNLRKIDKRVYYEPLFDIDE